MLLCWKNTFSWADYSSLIKITYWLYFWFPRNFTAPSRKNSRGSITVDHMTREEGFHQWVSILAFQDSPSFLWRERQPQFSDFGGLLKNISQFIRKSQSSVVVSCTETLKNWWISHFPLSTFTERITCVFSDFCLKVCLSSYFSYCQIFQNPFLPS